MGAYLQTDLRELGIDARWLDREHAEHAFMFASSYIKPDSYALNPATVSNIDLHLVTSRSVAHAWVKERFPTEGTTQLIYGRDEVCVLDSSVFIERWQDIFVPGRDDAIVLHNLSKAVLFYCHEDEIEIGERCAYLFAQADRCDGLRYPDIPRGSGAQLSVRPALDSQVAASGQQIWNSASPLLADSGSCAMRSDRRHFLKVEQFGVATSGAFWVAVRETNPEPCS